MPTLEQIQEQVKHLDSASQFLGRREIKELPNILLADENIEAIIQGTYNAGNGILVATSKRLIFVDKGLLYGLKIEEFPFDKISSVQYSTGLLLGDLTIFASGNKAKIDNVDNKTVRSFGDYIRNKLSIRDQAKTAAESKPAVENELSDDVINKLERLAKLKDQGILTEEEFKQQKTKLLNL